MSATSHHDNIVAMVEFHRELRAFFNEMRDHERAVAEADFYNVDRPEPSPEVEQLRQSLIRRSGAVQQIVERILGGSALLPELVQGQAVSDWDLALYPHNGFDGYNQTDYAGKLADRLLYLIGKFEAEPSLLDSLPVRTSDSGVAAGAPRRPHATSNTRAGASMIEIFFSYSHRDEVLRDELEKHLSLLKRQGTISSWHDRRIGPGQEWKGMIDERLNSVHVILLLVSPDFLASDYCYDTEMTRALERHNDGEARVIPIILRAVDWHGSPFSKLQALPTDAKPVTSWPNQDEAFTDVARGIRRVVEELASYSQSQDSQSGAASTQPFDHRSERLAQWGSTRTTFPLVYTHAGVEAQALRGSVAIGEFLVACFQHAEISDKGVDVWLTVENRGAKACRWFGCTLTAYGSPAYVELTPNTDSRVARGLVDIYPGEQFTFHYFFLFTPNARGPKFLMCNSWDQPFTFWWARGA